MTDDFIEALKRARAEKKLSQEDVARALGVSRAAVGQWERGLTTPTFANMQTLSRLLGFADRLILANPKNFEGREAQFWRVMTSGKIIPDDEHTVPVTHVCLNAMATVIKTAGKSIDHLYRTDYLRKFPNAYGLAVLSDAMSPRFEIGETLYVVPEEEPAVGEYTVLNLQLPETDEVLSVLRKLTADTGEILQFQRMKDRDLTPILRKHVQSLHRVVPWNEVIELRAEGKDKSD